MLERYEEAIGAEAVNEIAGALLRAAGDVLKSHGDRDPNVVPILAAGFVLAIRRMDKIDPIIGKVIRLQLLEKA